MSENEIRAIAVREVAGYIERIHRPGLVNLVTVLMDLEAAAARMEQGVTARGSLRSAGVAAEEPEWEYLPALPVGSPPKLKRTKAVPAGPWVPVKQEGADQ